MVRVLSISNTAMRDIRDSYNGFTDDTLNKFVKDHVSEIPIEYIRRESEKTYLLYGENNYSMIVGWDTRVENLKGILALME